MNRRPVRIFCGIFSAYAVLSLPAWFGPAFLEGISSYIYMTPILAVYLFHWLGIPGLLQHGGHCGWGLCAPTITGWVVLVMFWIGVVWLVALGIAHLTLRPRNHAGSADAKH